MNPFKFLKRLFISVLFISLFNFTQSQTINLLFLGNSFTANTQLNVTVKAMINAGTSGKTVNLSDAVILYGQNLDAHWKNAASRTKVQSGSYNYIILQGYINAGVGAAGMAQMRDTAIKYGTLFVNEANANSGIPIIFSHQANCNSIQTTWDFITNSYKTLATDASATLAPAALSWLQAKTMVEGLVTHDPDCHHQGEIGNYLNACVFYYLITGQSPVGNPCRTSYATTIDADLALILQQAAAFVVESQNGTAVTGVSISPASVAALPAGDTTTLTAVFSPANATNKSVIWTTSNPVVATVNIKGLVTGNAAGTATITANSIDGSKIATALVTVTEEIIPGSNAAAYRYLKYQIDGDNGYDVYMYEIEWMVGATAYPAVKATSGAHAGITASSQMGSYPGWMAYDGVFTVSGMWVPAVRAYPCVLTMDLGAGVAITPTAVKIQNDQFHSQSGFKCLGSNDNVKWYLLFEKSGLASSSWTTGVMINFDFPAQITDNQAPSVPSGLTASIITDSSFTLSWTASADNMGGVGGVSYEVLKNGISVGSTTTTSFAVTGLSASTSYAMTVKAKDSAIPENVSAASSALNVTTTVEGILFSDGEFITLGPLGGVFTSGGNNQKFFHTQMGGNYATKVTSGGNPGNAISMGANGCQVLLALKAPAAAQTWTISFDQKINGTVVSGPYFQVLGLTSGQSIAYTDGGGTGGTTLYTKIVTGSETTWTHKSYTISIPSGLNDVVFEWFYKGDSMLLDNIMVILGDGTTDTLAPSSPSGLASSVVTTTSFTLSWTASTDNVGVASYEVFRGTTSCGTTAATSLNVTSLTENTTYAMTVKAKDAAGNVSNSSSALNVTTSGIISIDNVGMLVSVYPNPATDFITVCISSDIESIIKLYDLKGTVHMAIKSNSQKKIKIPVAGLPKGLYFIEVTGGDVFEFIKFLKE